MKREMSGMERGHTESDEEQSRDEGGNKNHKKELH